MGDVRKGWAKTIRRTLGDASLIPLDTARRMASAQPHGADPVSDMRAPAPSYSAEARISDVMPRFLASGENGRWKPSTLINMRAAADTHILPLLGNRKVRDLTPEEVARWHLDVAAKSSAVRMALSTLSGLMLYPILSQAFATCCCAAKASARRQSGG